MGSHKEDMDVAVVDTVPSFDVIKYEVVVEHTEAVSISQLKSGSDEYVSWLSGPMAIVGHDGRVPCSVKPKGHSIPGGSPGGYIPGGKDQNQTPMLRLPISMQMKKN
jgi:hypothetical protein